MTKILEHVLEDQEWHAVVPAGEVWGMRADDHQPRILWIGKTAVEGPFHSLSSFEETDCIPIEFHRYKGSWNADGFDKTFEGEVVASAQRIPATVWLTELGFGIKAIDRPADAEFEEIQLKLPIAI
ncbi:MAG TPA: hypothetical protein VJJ78_02020 [Candidatus Saccharimonadales bacterium]|nr:MAG: hypothetical protein A3D14_01435 [Candidatus Saccharibacteria bacterium RIFCSPHIGHO2_02_FULL_47_12]HLB66352.1 hypothetical protein [Candidatus Saccharimonadales bacterium]